MQKLIEGIKIKIKIFFFLDRDKSYQCRIAECGRRFADRSNWLNHEQIHGGERGDVRIIGHQKKD